MKEKQNVQRLGDANPPTGSVNIPLALQNEFQPHPVELLEKRQKILKCAANSKKLKNYRLNELPRKFNGFCRSWVVGLVLSDASIQYGLTKDELGLPKTARLKLQQANFNQEFLTASEQFLLPWNRGITRLSSRPMMELTSLQCYAVKEIADLFQDPNKKAVPGGNLQKVIPPNFVFICFYVFFL